MPTITVKNIPDELYARLKTASQASRRSLNSEIIVLLERAVRSRKLDPEAVLARARLLRQRTLARPISDKEFTQAKAAGRR